MSDAYREWEIERAEDAWDDIRKIADTLSYDDTDEIDKLEEVYRILKEGGWL